MDRDLAFAGGGGLDRAAHLRAGDGWRAGAAVLPVWRGKVLVDDDGALMRLAADHPAPDDAGAGPAMLLGMADGRAIAVRDMSGWVPATLPESQLFFDSTEQVHPAIPGGRFVELRGAMTGLSALDGELAATARALAAWHHAHRFCAACGQPSDVVQSGWQRRCPACNATHFPRTDPVAIMVIERGDRVLLGRSPGWPDGMYSCLAGFIEPGETVEAAVRREVAEETGVRVGAVRLVASQPWPFPASLMLGCVGQAVSDTITPDPAEIEDAMWLSRADLARVFDGAHPAIRAPRRGAIAGWMLRRWLDGDLG